MGLEDSGRTGDTPPAGRPSHRSRLRSAWLGFSLPLLAAVGVAVLVAAAVLRTSFEFDAGGQAGSPDGMQASDPEEEQAPADEGSEATSGPLDRVALEMDRPVETELGPVGTAAVELQEQGLIGADDKLTPVGDTRPLGTFEISRANQEHEGLPIFAAQVVVTAEGQRIVKISGHAAPDVELDTATPANDYAATVALAESLLNHDITPVGEATLVIFPVDGGYRLAWLGEVVVDSGREEVAFDAETGRVLHRVPTSMPAAPAGI